MAAPQRSGDPAAAARLAALDAGEAPVPTHLRAVLRVELAARATGGAQRAATELAEWATAHASARPRAAEAAWRDAARIITDEILDGSARLTDEARHRWERRADLAQHRADLQAAATRPEAAAVITTAAALAASHEDHTGALPMVQQVIHVGMHLPSREALTGVGLRALAVELEAADSPHAADAWRAAAEWHRDVATPHLETRRGALRGDGLAAPAPLDVISGWGLAAVVDQAHAATAACTRSAERAATLMNVVAASGSLEF